MRSSGQNKSEDEDEVVLSGSVLLGPSCIIGAGSQRWEANMPCTTDHDDDDDHDCDNDDDE